MCSQLITAALQCSYLTYIKTQRAERAHPKPKPATNSNQAAQKPILCPELDHATTKPTPNRSRLGQVPIAIPKYSFRLTHASNKFQLDNKSQGYSWARLVQDEDFFFFSSPSKKKKTKKRKENTDSAILMSRHYTHDAQLLVYTLSAGKAIRPVTKIQTKIQQNASTGGVIKMSNDTVSP